MSLYKRTDSSYWWVKIQVNGRRLQRSTGTADKQEAQEVHDRLKANLWRLDQLGDKPTKLWEEAVVRFLEETASKRSHSTDIQRLRAVHPHLEGLTLQDVTRNVLDTALMEAARNSRKGCWSPSTYNRHTAVVRTVLRKAWREWEWVDTVPVFRVYEEPDGRKAWLTEEQFTGLIAALPYHLRPVCWFALETGLRRSNVIHLRWDHINIAKETAWVDAAKIKTKKDLVVPLNEIAMDVLYECEGKHPEYVFTYFGKPFQRFSSETWFRALEKAGLEKGKVTFHTLRHTWASWHSMEGTHPLELMELGGWSSLKMVKRYSHLGEARLADAAKRIVPKNPVTI
jgi:integrase